MKESTYDKFPVVTIDEKATCWNTWKAILQEITNNNQGKKILVIECYHGVNEKEMVQAIQNHLAEARIFYSQNAFKSTAEIDALTFDDVTEDRIFGYRTRLQIDAFFDDKKKLALREALQQSEQQINILIGIGASQIFPEADLLVYADMARWEIQQRMRRNEVANIGSNNYELEIARKYKRAYFVDWLVCDRIKKKTFNQWDYIIDTNQSNQPKMIAASTFKEALQQTVNQPFRLVPFFDPGPWGGQWMREVCDLDKEAPNYAWCFDCVPEENSILYKIGNNVLEFPASNVVYFQSENLLGAGVYARFGDEFPIRFDFLDTMDGGNLSLQVHPLTQYIQEHFGMNYTQDESYYMLDAGPDATVYLGLKESVNPEEMIAELKAAQETGGSFDAEKHVEKWPAKKHDHFLIPAGTVHCSGTDSMVLEISATPYIFTFKLWDWGRLGLDGLPRPINIERGADSIQWNRRTEWTKNNLINRFEALETGDGWRSEKTGLHETEFIETIRHWFSKAVTHETNGNLNVLNLIEGSEAIIESPTNSFAPFKVHYAETFIIPANVAAYTIRPTKEETCGTIKAYVK